MEEVTAIPQKSDLYEDDIYEKNPMKIITREIPEESPTSDNTVVLLASTYCTPLCKCVRKYDAFCMSITHNVEHEQL